MWLCRRAAYQQYRGTGCSKCSEPGAKRPQSHAQTRCDRLGPVTRVMGAWLPSRPDSCRPPRASAPASACASGYAVLHPTATTAPAPAHRRQPRPAAMACRTKISVLRKFISGVGTNFTNRQLCAMRPIVLIHPLPITSLLWRINILAMSTDTFAATFDLTLHTFFLYPPRRMQASRSNVSIRTPTRRRWLMSMMTLSSAISCGVWHQPVNAAAALARSQSNLLRLISQPHAKLVGDALLPQIVQKTPAELVSTLMSRLSLFSREELTGVCTVEALQQAFQISVQADFAESRCMSVSGWVMARTEVELCALAALSANRA